MTGVHIRNLWGERMDSARIVDEGPPAIAEVAGFGHVLCGKYNGGWRAGIAQGGPLIWRDPRVVGDDVEVELLPNVSGGDRIVVVFEGLAAAGATESPLGAQS